MINYNLIQRRRQEDVYGNGSVQALVSSSRLCDSTYRSPVQQGSLSRLCDRTYGSPVQHSVSLVGFVTGLRESHQKEDEEGLNYN